MAETEPRTAPPQLPEPKRADVPATQARADEHRRRFPRERTR